MAVWIAPKVDLTLYKALGKPNLSLRVRRGSVSDSGQGDPKGLALRLATFGGLLQLSQGSCPWPICRVVWLVLTCWVLADCPRMEFSFGSDVIEVSNVEVLASFRPHRDIGCLRREC